MSNMSKREQIICVDLIINLIYMALNKFYDFDSYDYEDELVIVCGRGTGALILLVEQLLNENSYKYDYELNNYTFYIWKK